MGKVRARLIVDEVHLRLLRACRCDCCWSGLSGVMGLLVVTWGLTISGRLSSFHVLCEDKGLHCNTTTSHHFECRLQVVPPIDHLVSIIIIQFCAFSILIHLQ